MRVIQLRIANLERDALSLQPPASSLQPILQWIETMLGKGILWTFGAHDDPERHRVAIGLVLTWYCPSAELHMVNDAGGRGS